MSGRDTQDKVVHDAMVMAINSDVPLMSEDDFAHFRAAVFIKAVFAKPTFPFPTDLTPRGPRTEGTPLTPYPPIPPQDICPMYLKPPVKPPEFKQKEASSSYWAVPALVENALPLVERQVPSGNLFVHFMTNVRWSVLPEWDVEFGDADAPGDCIAQLAQRIAAESPKALLNKMTLHHPSFGSVPSVKLRLLSEAIGACGTFTALILTHAVIREDHLRTLVLEPSLAGRVTCLSVEYSGLDVYSMGPLVEALAVSPHLQHMSLRGNPIRDLGVQLLCTTLPLATSLKSLDLGFSTLTAAGVIHFSECLRVCASVESVRIDGASLSKRCARHLYETVTDCGWLREVSTVLCTGVPSSFKKSLDVALMSRGTWPPR